MSLQDYVNRKYDFLALQSSGTQREKSLGLSLFAADTSGKLCVGIQKLAQRWLLEFLTETGSIVGQPERGCGFMTTVRQGKMRTALNANVAFATSSLAVRRQLVNEEYVGMPDDERIAAVELLGIAFLPGYLSIGVKINSRAGDTRAVIIPVETLP